MPPVMLSDAAAMVRGMAPRLEPGRFRFCATKDPALAARCLPLALAMMVEEEGVSFVLPLDAAREIGFAPGPVMRHIALTATTSLEAFGLTAAVSAALARHGIACNIVAGYHHDHLFVPQDRAGEALAVLEALATGPISPEPKAPA